MLTIDQVQDALDGIADDIPPEIFRGLNGGIVLLPDTKYHPQGIKNDLYILGEYHFEPQSFGRYITIYYGSFCIAHGRLPCDAQVQKLKELLHHELTHHLENLAGDRSLEIQDAADIATYRRRHTPQSEEK